MDIARLLILAVTLGFVAGCTPAVAPPTNTPTATPAESPTVLATPTGMPTPTATPMLIPTPAAASPTPATETPPAPTPAAASPTPATETPPAPTPAVDQATWQGPVAISTGKYDWISLAVDAGGHGHVAAELDGSIRYLTNSNGTWVRERVTAKRIVNRGSISEYWRPSVGIDGDGRPWISYFHYEASDELGPWDIHGYYIAGGLGSWSRPAEMAGNNIGPVQIRDGRAHYAYMEPIGGWDVDCDPQFGPFLSTGAYATNTSGDWVTIPIPDAGGLAELRLGTDARVHLAFGSETCGAPDHVRVMTLHPDLGIVSISDVIGTTNLFVHDFVVDADGNAHLLLGSDPDDANRRELFYVSQSGDSWTSPVHVHDDADSASVAVDAAGRAHIAAVGAGGVRYFVRSGVEFTTTTLFEPLGRYRRIRIALDDHGRPHVLFGGGRLPNLWYAVGPNR